MGKAFSSRLGNLEARVVPVHPSHSDHPDSVTVDIVQWDTDNKFYWTVAYFVRSGDGIPCLRFVGERPLDRLVNWTDFRTMIQSGIGYLNTNRSDEDKESDD